MHVRGILTGTRWLLVAAAGCAIAADWPQWLGPKRNGLSQDTGLLREWPTEGPKLLWQLNDIGDGYSTPAVAGGRVFLLGNRGMDNEYVQALSVEDGKQLWQTRLGGVGNPNQQPPYPMTRSTPTVDGGCSTRKARMAIWLAWKRRLAKCAGGKVCARILAASPAIGRTPSRR